MAEQLQSHQPCPDCGSSDALATYDWGTKCYSCGVTKRSNSVSTPLKEKMTMHTLTLVQPTALEYRSVASRGIARDTCLDYGVGITNNHYYFPYYSGPDQLVAYKKRGTEQKQFSIEGAWKEAGLFGQQLFPKGGKYVTIVEGEFDALAAYQMLGSRYPVVSIRNGAGSALADCKANYEWIDSFENVVICFDADEQGRTAAAQVAELFGTKARVFKHEQGLKDACDYLSTQQSNELNLKNEARPCRILLNTYRRSS